MHALIERDLLAAQWREQVQHVTALAILFHELDDDPDRAVRAAAVEATLARARQRLVDLESALLRVPEVAR